MIDDWWFTKFTMLIYGLWLIIDGLLSLLCFIYGIWLMIDGLLSLLC